MVKKSNASDTVAALAVDTQLRDFYSSHSIAYCLRSVSGGMVFYFSICGID